MFPSLTPHTRAPARAPTTALLASAGLLAACLQTLVLQTRLFWQPPSPSLWQWGLALCPETLSPIQLWTLATFPLIHGSAWHWGACLLGLYTVGRSVEPIIGGRHLLGVLALGNLAGGVAHCAAVRLGWIPSGCLLMGLLPMVSTLAGVYATVLPGWRLGAAVLRDGSGWWSLPAGWLDTSDWRWVPKAKHTGWLAAGLGALWWASGWFPEGGPVAVLAGLGVGWTYTRMLGFGDRVFHERITRSPDLLERRVEHMNWEEFVATELNPVLEKISKHGLRSLTPEERRILRHSRRKLEGW